MPSSSTARITLELEAGADPIRGSIDHADGRRVCFWGWLELMEELRRAAAREPEQPSRPDTGQAPDPDAGAELGQSPTTQEGQR